MYIRWISTAVLMPISFMSMHAIGGTEYEIVSLKGDDPLWSLDGGTITTDGTIGELTVQNLTGWELRFTSPAGSRQILSSNGGAYIWTLTFDRFIGPNSSLPSFTAEDNQLIVNPSSTGHIHVIFSTQDVFSDSFVGNAVSFFPVQETPIVTVNDGPKGGVYLVDNSVDSSNLVGFESFFSNVSGNNLSTIAVPAGPFVIGQVRSIPEPSTLRFLLIVFFCLISIRRPST